MDKELRERAREMFDEHYKDGIWTGIGYSLIITWVAVFILYIILLSKSGIHL